MSEGSSAVLLSTCAEACGELSELVAAIYGLVSADGSAATLKQDKSVFTLADGLVQALLRRLLAPHVASIVGEEDESEISVDRPPFRAGELIAPAELEALVLRTRDRVDALSGQLAGGAFADLTPFIDPIDGTREFASRKGEQCTICIGFATLTGAAHAGIVYRPLTSPPTFALGCAAEGVARSSLGGGGGGAPRTHTPAGRGGGRRLVCSNGRLSEFVIALGERLGGGLVRAGGAGNKALLLLEGEASCYIQDRGVSRWDSCAAQAVLEAHGGCFAKLAAVAAEPGSRASYTYLASATNADFEPGLAALTPYNARAPPPPGGADAPPPLATSAEQLKPYSNTCGLFALPPSEMANLEEYRQAVREAAARHPPAYD